MTGINENMDKFNSKSESESLSLSPNVIAESAKGQDSKAAVKALLTELENLLSLVVESQSGRTSTLNTKGVDVSVSKKEEAQGLIKDLAQKNFNGLGEVSEIFNKILEENGNAPTVKEFLSIAKKASDALEKGFDTKKVTPESLLADKNMQAFLSGLSGEKKLDTKSDTKADTKSDTKSDKKSDKKSDTKNDYTSAIFNLALDVQNVISQLMNNQNSTNKLTDESSEVQQQNNTTLITTQLQDMAKQAQEQQKAGQQPWYMYVIAGVLAVAGAVLAAFTGGVAAGVVALVIGAVMGSPLGSKLTDALVTAMVGPNPTDAQKQGATAAAVAIIAVITTLLTCGSAGFVTGGAAAAEGAGEEAAEEVAEQAVKKGVTFSTKAFTSGLAGRAGGSFMQGFVGGGGASDLLETIILSTPGGSAWLKKPGSAIFMGLITALLAIAGSIGGGGSASISSEIRASTLTAEGLKDAIVVSKGLKNVAEGAQFAGNLADAGVAGYNFDNLNKLSKVEAELGNISAQINLSQANIKNLQGMQKNISSSSNNQLQVLQNALNGLLNTLVVEGKNQTSALTK